MTKSRILIISLFLFSLLFAACAGSDGSSTSTAASSEEGTTDDGGTSDDGNTTDDGDTTDDVGTGGATLVVKTGYFVDSAVGGVDFVSGGQSGTTDAAGTFTYEEGKQLSLSVGGVSAWARRSPTRT